MVCANCEKKLSKSVVPEVRKAAEMAKEGSTSKTGESAGRKVNPNMLLSKTKRFTPYSAKCKVCKCLLHQQGIYCLGCAYKAEYERKVKCAFLALDSVIPPRS
eukprot:TRINITY_DN4997_c0_g5_i6.p2 TRINITY_DN4997_c0_g5~~TRINITY_DN4997_c0_g5_i6.p2  ORF type:complete len:103 (-),score=27.35 TRINITY_DN4997_c0_g5_i6:289-597(-)